MRTAFEDFGATRTKTLDPAVFTAHVASYYNHYGTLRGEKLLLRWARQSFRLYCLKRKTLKEFVNQFRGNPKPGGKPPPLWAQGGALFPSGGPGERSVPVKGTRELIRETFPTVPSALSTRAEYFVVDCECARNGCALKNRDVNAVRNNAPR